MRKVLSTKFFERPVLEVAPDLLGKFLVRRITPSASRLHRGFGGQVGIPPSKRGRREEEEVAVMITEVEAYDGPEDKACHGCRGKTKRTEALFGPAGHFYVYLIYGMYWMLNIVADREGYPAAVLIRGAVFEDKNTKRQKNLRTKELKNLKTYKLKDLQTITGPGKLTKALKINKKLNGKKAEKAAGLWFEDRGVRVAKNPVRSRGRPQGARPTSYGIKRTPRIGVHYAGPWAKKPYRFLIDVDK